MTNNKKSGILFLGIVTLCLGIVFYLLGLKISGPFIFADEYTYFTFAESIYNGKSLSSYTQYGPLYPALISPFFFLKTMISIYHAIKIFNILIFLSAIIPAYLLADKLFTNRWLKLLLPFCVIISPFSGLLYLIWAEPLYITLLYWTLFLFCLHIQSPKIINGFLLGLLLASLYYAKPPAGIVVQIAALLTLGLFFLKNWQETRRLKANIPTLLALFTCFIIDLPWMLHYLHMGLSIIGYGYIKSTLTSTLGEQGYLLFVFRVIESVFYQLSYFFVGTWGLIVLPLVLVIRQWKNFSRTERYMLLFITLSIMALMAISALGMSSNAQLNYRMPQGRYYSLWLPFITVFTLHLLFKPETLNTKNMTQCLILTLLITTVIAIIASPLYVRNPLAYNSMPDLSPFIYLASDGGMDFIPLIVRPSDLLRTIVPLFFTLFAFGMICGRKKNNIYAWASIIIAIGSIFATYTEQYYMIKCGKSQNAYHKIYIDAINAHQDASQIIFDKKWVPQEHIALFWTGKPPIVKQ